MMDNLHKIDLFSLGIKIIIIYIALLVAYTILTYIYCSVKYRSAQKGVEEYYRELGQLKKIYDREEKRAGRLTEGGKAHDSVTDIETENQGILRGA